MGVAATNRGSVSIRKGIARDFARPAEFDLMDSLNAMTKFEDAGTPFGEIVIVQGHGGWWAECPVTGFGYWYKTLREAVKRWNVNVTGFSHGKWTAKPFRKEE